MIFTSPDEPDSAPSTNVGSGGAGYDVVSSAAATGWADIFITTNTSSQIGGRAASGTASTCFISTRGFKDWRRS